MKVQNILIYSPRIVRKVVEEDSETSFSSFPPAEFPEHMQHLMSVSSQSNVDSSSMLISTFLISFSAEKEHS